MKSSTALQTIKSLTYQQSHLNIIFENEWYQEDIEALRDLTLSPLMPLQIKEKNIGADREDIRFCWNENYFILNFEFYSQSCWIEAQDDLGKSCLLALHSAISKIK